MILCHFHVSNTVPPSAFFQVEKKKETSNSHLKRTASDFIIHYLPLNQSHISLDGLLVPQQKTKKKKKGNPKWVLT